MRARLTGCRFRRQASSIGARLIFSAHLIDDGDEIRETGMRSRRTSLRKATPGSPPQSIQEVRTQAYAASWKSLQWSASKKPDYPPWQEVLAAVKGGKARNREAPPQRRNAQARDDAAPS
jgi:hypothetical protein